MHIKELLFNPTQHTIRSVRLHIFASSFTREEAMSVLRKEVCHLLEGKLPAKEQLPSIGRLQHNPQESNMIMVWGDRGAGKTALIGSLFAQKGFRVCGRSNADKQRAEGRFDPLRKIFRKKGWQELPDATDDEPVEMLETVYKPHRLGRSYPMTFVEVNLTDTDGMWDKSIDWGHLRRLMEKSIGHIHLFCLDCSPKEGMKLRDSLDRQVRHLDAVLKYLQRQGLTNTANAVYIVVTKTDVMRAPKPYIDNAAQTLVTSAQAAFWQSVRNICYEKDIANVQPLTFSIGDFALKDYVRIDTARTERIFKRDILPKCLPKKSRIERVFDFRNQWINWMLLVPFAALLLWAGYKTYIALADTPETVVRPFDYGEWFEKEMHVFDDGQYDKTRGHYQRLVRDLETEQALLTDSGTNVLPDSVAADCDKQLTKAFAPIMVQAIEEFFKDSRWASQKVKMDHLKEDISIIADNKNTNSKERERFTYCQKNIDSLDTVRACIKKSKSCWSTEDIDNVKSSYRKWRREPFTNDAQLKAGLEKMVQTAYDSCAAHYCSVADHWLEYYKNEKQRITHSNKSESDKDTAVNNAKIRLRNSTSDIIGKIDILIEKIDGDTAKDQLQGAKRRLEGKKNEVTRITETIKQPKKNLGFYLQRILNI